MGPPSRFASDPPPQFRTTDSSSAPDPPIPLDPHADSENPTITIAGNDCAYDGMHWHTWDRTIISYAPPRSEDLPCPPTSLIDPHDSIRAARANIAASERNPQAYQTRSCLVRPSVAASPSRTLSASASTPASGGVQPSAQASSFPTSSGTATASSAILSRDRELQIEHYAAQLQAVATLEDIEHIARSRAPTVQALRHYYRTTAADRVDWEKAREERWHSERGREGMLFGSELSEEL